MITANDARNMAMASSLQIIKTQLADIEHDIKSAAEKGKREVWHYERVCEVTKETLRNSGYTLSESDNQIDGYSLGIRW